jgi:hypothetical protein
MKNHFSNSISITSLLALILMIVINSVNAQIVTIPINTESYTLLLQTDKNKT